MIHATLVLQYITKNACDRAITVDGFNIPPSETDLVGSITDARFCQFTHVVRPFLGFDWLFLKKANRMAYDARTQLTKIAYT